MESIKSNNPSFNPRWRIAGFGLIVLVAFLVRLDGINQQGYWYDEILTLKISALPYSQIPAALEKTENNKPPVYYLFMHNWLGGGSSETWARLPSAIFGASTCGVMFLAACRLLGPAGGSIAGGFLTFSTFHLDYSNEARMYALFGFEASVALYCLVLFLQERKTLHLICFGVASVFVSYTFPYGFFLLGLSGLILLAEWRELGWNRSVALLAVLIVSFALFSPWLLRMVHEANAGQDAQFYKGPPWTALAYSFYTLGYGFDLGASTTDLQNQGASYFKLHHFQAAVTLFAYAILGVIIIRGIVSLRSNVLLLTLSLGGLAIFLVGPAIISVLKPLITYNPRYAFLALLPFSILLAAGIEAFWKQGSLGKSVTILFAVLFTSSLYFFFTPSYQREDLRAASRYVDGIQPPLRAVVVCANYLDLVVSYYAHGPAPVIPVGDDGSGLVAQQFPGLKAKLQDANRFAVIYARPDHGDSQRKLLPWMRDHYAVESDKSWAGVEVLVCSVKPGESPSDR